MGPRAPCPFLPFGLWWAWTPISSGTAAAGSPAAALVLTSTHRPTLGRDIWHGRAQRGPASAALVLHLRDKGRERRIQDSRAILAQAPFNITVPTFDGQHQRGLLFILYVVHVSARRQQSTYDVPVP